MSFRMPSKAYLEGRDESGMHGKRVDLDSADLTLMLDDSEPIDELEIIGEDGAVITSAGRTELRGMSARRLGSGLHPLAGTGPSDAVQALLDAFPQIYFMNPSEGDDLPLVYWDDDSDVESLANIDDRAARALKPALDRVPAPALSAIRSIGVGNFRKGTTTIGVSYGSSLIISTIIETDPLQMIETVVHEATHNYQFLVDGNLKTELINPDAWPDDVTKAAALTWRKFDDFITCTEENEGCSGDMHGSPPSLGETLDLNARMGRERERSGNNRRWR
jgi:hypothetical protein